MGTLGKILALTAAAAAAVIVTKKVIERVKKSDTDSDIQRAYLKLKQRWSRQEKESAEAECEHEDFRSVIPNMPEDDRLEFSFNYNDDEFLTDRLSTAKAAQDDDIPYDETDDGELTAEEEEFLKNTSFTEENAEMTEEELQRLIDEETAQEEIEKLLRDEGEGE